MDHQQMMLKTWSDDLVLPMFNLLEHSSTYSDTPGSLWFCSKDEQTAFNADIAYNNYNNFKSFNCKTKLLKDTVANGNNGILKNATINMPLKYLSNFRRTLEMLLINCKVELKLRQTKHCVLAAAGADNVDANFIILLLLSKTQNCKFLSSLSLQKAKKNYQNFLAKDLKD